MQKQEEEEVNEPKKRIKDKRKEEIYKYMIQVHSFTSFWDPFTMGPSLPWNVREETRRTPHSFLPPPPSPPSLIPPAPPSLPPSSYSPFNPYLSCSYSSSSSSCPPFWHRHFPPSSSTNSSSFSFLFHLLFLFLFLLPLL